MRYLLIFMFLVGIFMFGKRSCHFPFMGTKGSGPIKTEVRNVNGFKGIELDLAGEVEVRVSDTYSVEVQAQENLLPLLRTEVENGRLKIYFGENVSYSESLKVLVSGPAFNDLSIGGSGKISVLTPIQSERMNIDIAGSGDVLIPQATFGAVECSISGSGSIELGGTANATQAAIGGSGDIRAKQLATNELRASIAGSGSVTAHVVQVLKADIAGSGDIFYSGEPTVESNVSGSGSVKKI
jgi:Putative auto-transporter adhesin, head GIN domain